MLRRKKSKIRIQFLLKKETIIDIKITKIQKSYYHALIHVNADIFYQK
jgi:hypothetical protein